MKTTGLLTPALVLAFLSAINYRLSTTFAQGSLTPPAPGPGPTMKTLTQIEPRTPISSGPFTISQSGAYYLTGNLSVSFGNAITIATNGVTLDLNGFTISTTSLSASGTGIAINGGLRNITIANGFVQGGITNNGIGVYSGGGFLFGIEYFGTAPANVLASRISVSGCLINGVDLGTGDSTIVESCTVRTIGGNGIVASTVKACAALDCGSTAITGNQVSDCQGQASGNATGVSGLNILNCTGISATGSGLFATYTAENCYGQSAGNGVGVGATTALNCYGISNTGTGVYAYYITQSCYGYSTNYIGIRTITAENCYGFSAGSGDGISAGYTAVNCYGSSGSGTGLDTTIAQDCYGFSSTGTGLHAYIGSVSFGTTENITFKYNMP